VKQIVADFSVSYGTTVQVCDAEAAHKSNSAQAATEAKQSFKSLIHKIKTTGLTCSADRKKTKTPCQ
jgi:hypothetical protein